MRISRLALSLGILTLISSLGISAPDDHFSKPVRIENWGDQVDVSLNLHFEIKDEFKLYAYDLKSEKANTVKWIYPCENDCRLRMISDWGVLLQSRNHRNEHRLIYLNPASGKEVWTRTLQSKNNIDFLGHTPWSSEKIFGISEGNEYVFLNAEGKVLKSFQNKDDLVAYPVFFDGKIAWSYSAGKVELTDLEDQVLAAWAPEILHRNEGIYSVSLLGNKFLGVCLSTVNGNSCNLAILNALTLKLVTIFEDVEGMTQDSERLYLGRDFGSRRNSFVEAYSLKNLEKLWKTDLREVKESAKQMHILDKKLVTSYAFSTYLFDTLSGEILDRVGSKCFINQTTYIEPRSLVSHESCGGGEADDSYLQFYRLEIRE